MTPPNGQKLGMGVKFKLSEIRPQPGRDTASMNLSDPNSYVRDSTNTYTGTTDGLGKISCGRVDSPDVGTWKDPSGLTVASFPNDKPHYYLLEEVSSPYANPDSPYANKYEVAEPAIIDLPHFTSVEGTDASGAPITSTATNTISVSSPRTWWRTVATS